MDDKSGLIDRTYDGNCTVWFDGPQALQNTIMNQLWVNQLWNQLWEPIMGTHHYRNERHSAIMGTHHYRNERHSEFEFPVDAQAENAVNSRLGYAGAESSFAEITASPQSAEATTKNSVGQRSSDPFSQKPGQRRTLGGVGLHSRQQLAGFLASAVAAGTGLRAMLVDSLRLTGDHAEQFAEILHETTPDLRRNCQSVKQRSKLLRCRTSLTRTSLPSRPVQQAQIIRS